MPDTVQSQRGSIPLDICLDVAGVMMLFIRPDESVGLINRRGCEILACGERDVLDHNWFDTFMPVSERARARGIFRDLLRGRVDANENVENRVVAADGTERLIRWHNAVVWSDGQVVGTISSGLDITEYRAKEAALRENEARSRAILETTVDAIITADEDGRIDSFNQAATDMFGYTEADVVGHNLSMLMPSPYREEHDTYMDAYLTTGRRKIIGIGREVVGKRSDGSVFPLDLAVSEFVVGGRRMFTGVLRDISERRELEQEVLRISEDERERIGRDLHDGLGSLLTGTALGVHALYERARRGERVEAGDLERIAEMIDEGARQAHSLSRGLAPVRLESEGLVAALREMAGGVRGVSGTPCTVDVQGELPTISPTVGMQLYRIAQEAVNNAVKHAHASRIEIELATRDDHLSLLIRDDGVGLQPDVGDGGMGMHIMPYRARMIDGVFSVDSDERGTVVRCHVPLRRLAIFET